MIEKVKRVGHKVKEVAQRIGHKVSGATAKVGRISKVVEKVSGVIGKVGGVLAPIAGMINPAVGAGLATVSAGAGQVSRVAGKVGARATAIGDKAKAFEDKIVGKVNQGLAITNNIEKVKKELKGQAVSLVKQQAQVLKSKAIRQGRSIVQDPAVSMMNLRSLSKGVGGSKLSIRDAYKRGQELGISKSQIADRLRSTVDMSKLRGDQLLRLDKRFL